MLKPEILIDIRKYKNNKKKHVVNELLKPQAHNILQLPPYHLDLNPIEIIWSAMKRHIAKRNVIFKTNNIITICDQQFSKMMENDWKPLYD